MEVTKWLKPSISVSRIGDSASVQAVTRVNAEQALYGTRRCQGVSGGTHRFFIGRVSPFDLAAASSSDRCLCRTLGASERAGTIGTSRMTIRGELASGHGSSRHNLVFDRSIRT